jgi:hypothetical protein
MDHRRRDKLLGTLSFLSLIGGTKLSRGESRHFDSDLHVLW